MIPRRSPRPIDWQEVHARLERATAAAAPSPEHNRALLERRARELARAPERPSCAEMLELICFSLAGERYALETRHLREVVRLTEVTPVPGTPDHLTGVVNLRGEVLALFDLRRLFGLADEPLNARARVLVLGDAHAEFGIVAAEVHELMPLSRAALLEPPASLADVGREFLRGVTSEALAVLDGTLLLRDPRFHIELRDNTATPLAPETTTGGT